MKISLNWLSDYVSWEGSPEDLAERLTLAGLNVEGIERFAISFPGVVVAEVRTREQHPDADKLSLCTVWDGTEELQVVCGAPNVRAGLKVLLARVGAVLPGDFKIKKSKIRGVVSMGMICSASELELSADAEGIMVLETDLPAGTPADELYGYQDVVLDVEVTPNRPDWLSHYGVAREVSALYGTLLDTPETWSPPKTGPDQPDVSVEIEDFDDCPRYTAHLARDIAVGEAPDWMQKRLLAVGLRPISSVVDITNYVMLELGQPLHAFDRDRIGGGRIVIRRAAAGEKLTTLDGQEHELLADDLLIADANGGVALAGVMGGADSEVSAGTTSVLLESAFFDPGLVRATSRRLQLLSDSSYRFERGADWSTVDLGAKRALFLLQQHADAHISSVIVDRQDPDRKEPEPVTLRIQQVNRLLGSDLSATEIIGHLQSLGLKCQPLGQASDRDSRAGRLNVTVPSFRRDIHQEVDLIEEVARLAGFGALGDGSGFRPATSVTIHPRDRRLAAVRTMLEASGHHEIVTSSFMSRSDLDRLALPHDDPRRETLSVLEPHHGGETLLRTSLVPSLLDVARHNINADRSLPLRFFQCGRAYLPAGTRRSAPAHADDALLPEEPQVLQVAVVGRDDDVYGGLPAGLMELKALVGDVAVSLGIALELEASDAQPYLRHGLQWVLRSGEEIVGSLGTLAPPVLRAFEVDAHVQVLELDLARLDLESMDVRFAAFARFPAAKRDLSLVVPDGVPYADVETCIRESGGPLLAGCSLFDHFRGESVGDGKSALGIRLQFQSTKGNLKGKAVDKAIDTIGARLAERFGVQIRS